ncbi:MAG: hypothetical protein K2M95_04515, partial [Clostridiales bacterium]|nr:hypothetical protein [Clostridiales bacterium]
ILGVDFAANASSKAIKEDISLSAAITASGVTSAGTTIAADGRSVTFAYNGTYAENKIDQSGMSGGRWRHGGNNVGMDGSVQSVKLAPGTYLLEAWGAEGGVSYQGTVGGKGGYVKGYYTVTGNSPITIYVAVGGKGSDNYINNTAPATETNRSLAFVGNDWKNLAKGGGWNGGGGIIATDSAGGGGATHFALSNHGQLKNYKTYGSSMIANTNQYEPTGVTADYSGDVLMVAGGGGGAPWENPTEHKQDGAGGGLTGGEAAYWPGTTTGWSSGNTCHGLGGTQTAGGGHQVRATTAHLHLGASANTASTNWKTHPTNGFFGQGGIGIGHDHAGGGGGGGWYGGGGGFVLGGGGGSSYTKAGVIKEAEHTQGNRTGHGMAKITLLGDAAKQSTVPTVTLTRHDSKTFAFAGTNATNSLLGTHPQNLALSAAVNNVYQVNGLDYNQITLLNRTFTDAEKADAPTNSWLTYSFTTNGVTLQAKRYWTGTKEFYIKVKDTNNAQSWFKLNIQVEGGELKKDATLPTAMLDDFKFGKSTTQVPTERRRKRETSPLRFASVEVTEVQRRLIP